MRIFLLFFFFVICYSSDIDLEAFEKRIKEFFKSEIKNKTEYLLQVIKNDGAILKKELNEKIERGLKEIKKDEKDSHSSICGDNSWIQYKDEKCIKFFNTTEEYLVNYENALKFCKRQDSTGNLIMIRTKEEQQFIEKYLFETNFKFEDESIWIGAKNNSKRYIWEDNTTMNYTNWSNDLEDDDNHKCAAIITKKKNKGKWTNFICNKKSLIFCQKSQQWTFQYLKETFLQSKKEIQDSIYTIKVEKNCQKNQIPIGFIYVQLPNEKSPSDIWPSLTWKDVSSTYANVFFRVTGGDAAAFGQVQEDNAPRLTHIDFHNYDKHPDDIFSHRQWNVSISKNGNSKIYEDGKYHALTGLTVTMSGGEVRPRNMAIRVWKRTA